MNVSNKITFSVAFLCMMFCSFPVFASVTGTVTDPAGSPFSGALVTFTDESNPENEYSSYTDNEGKYTISPVIVEEEIPSGFRLYQNYPNPFNPTTTIPYSLENSGFINLSIYNVLGQKVRILVDGYQSAGEHNVTWDAHDDTGKGVAAGIYIYQLRIEGNVKSKKLLLIDGGVSGIAIGTYQGVTHGGFTAPKANIAESTTYRVTIAGENIVTYEESGITLIDGEIYDFVVIRIIVIEGITFVTIPGGTFQMGDEVGDLDDRCWPVHTVTVSSFDMSIYEVTNAQYAEYLNAAFASGDIEMQSGDVYGKTGDWSGQSYLDIDAFFFHGDQCWLNYSDGVFSVGPGHENWPVVAVTWYGSKAFAEYYGFDLPREAEWEYACRGGKQYKYGTDDGTISTSKAYYYNPANVPYPSEVGLYPSNPFGLYNMSGNVSEWCNDWYDDYSSASVTDPTGPSSGSKRVVRFGSWGATAKGCRSALRTGSNPTFIMNGDKGFRVVRRP